MTDFFESDSFVSPSQVKQDVVNRLKEPRAIRSLELQFKGDDLRQAKEFAVMLGSLKRQGVKISHEFLIRLDFPRGLARERALTIVENMPKPVNGSVKVRIGLEVEPK
jgi:hypothetical protein